MAELTYRERGDPRHCPGKWRATNDVVFLGEDVAKAGGVFKATVGLYEQFGPLRVRDTPIFRAGHSRRRHGRGDDRTEADCRDHVSRISSRSASTTSPTNSPRAGT